MKVKQKLYKRQQHGSAGNIQFDEQGRLRHFLTIQGLNKSNLENFFLLADSFRSDGNRRPRKLPLLRGKTVASCFFETSTRTYSTFDLAAKRLTADVVNLNIATASVHKGESLLDTLKTLQAMAVDLFIIRHPDSGSAEFIARHLLPDSCVINAGDGYHAHPTQAVIDMYTIWQNKKDFSSLRVAIVGDILHSRVARSNIEALKILAAQEIRLVAPRTLLPADASALGVQVFNNLEDGLRGVHVIMLLRLQKERMQGSFLPSEGEYYRRFGITSSRLALAAADAIVMHPGPINRGVEISSAIVDSQRTMILQQVANGVAARMAIMAYLFSDQKEKSS